MTTSKLMNDDQFSGVEAACESVLRMCARDKRVIYYNELVGLLPWPFEFNMGYNAHRALLGEVLWRVGHKSEAQGIGLLPALAVSKATGRPSGRVPKFGAGTVPEVAASGFYSVAVEFDRDLSDPDRMLLDEQAALYKAFAA
jgi:hypothetical protein